MTIKTLFGITGMASTVIAAHAASDVTAAPLAQQLPPDPNILYAMLGQELNNPSSLLVIAFLCIVAWLCDDTPLINSRYIAHICVIPGASIYWLFTTWDSVPKTFPHPLAVFVVNGSICGFVAFLLPRHAVARLIHLVRGDTGNHLAATTNPPK